MRRRPFALALAGWTFLVWTTRISNVWRDEALDGGERLGRTALALAFTMLALAVVVTLWRRAEAASRLAVGALAGLSILVWVVRDVAIVAADHDLGFTAVHVVLGVVSIVLSVLALREVRRSAAAVQPVSPPVAARPR